MCAVCVCVALLLAFFPLYSSSFSVYHRPHTQTHTVNKIIFYMCLFPHLIQFLLNLLLFIPRYLIYLFILFIVSSFFCPCLFLLLLQLQSSLSKSRKYVWFPTFLWVFSFRGSFELKFPHCYRRLPPPPPPCALPSPFTTHFFLTLRVFPYRHMGLGLGYAYYMYFFCFFFFVYLSPCSIFYFILYFCSTCCCTLYLHLRACF